MLSHGLSVLLAEWSCPLLPSLFLWLCMQRTRMELDNASSHSSSFALFQALLFVFSILRKVAWDYGRLALVTDADR